MAFERVNGWMKILPGLWRSCTNANANDVSEQPGPVAEHAVINAGPTEIGANGIHEWTRCLFSGLTRQRRRM